MTVTIPRAELNALAERYGGEGWSDGDDLTAEEVRDSAARLRAERPYTCADRPFSDPAATGIPATAEACAFADGLDALVDRIEREVAA